jgi:hypothetical protein
VVILPPQIIIIIIIIIIIMVTITTTTIIKNIGGDPEWSFAPGPPDTFARPCCGTTICCFSQEIRRGRSKASVTEQNEEKEGYCS